MTRFLEVGPVSLVKAVYPDETVFVGTAAEPIASNEAGAFDFSVSTSRRILKLLGSEGLEAVFVTRFSNRDAGGLSAFLRLIANRKILRRGIPIARVFGDRMLHFGTRAPIIVFDPSDAPFVAPHALWLWRRASVVFKRELPLDRWKVFMRTAHTDLPTPRFRRRPEYRDLIEKLRPMSLGLGADRENALSVPLCEKTTDIFFAGELSENSYVRQTGYAELCALRKESVVVDVPERPLPRSEFYERCARARLVWSPQGLGHDCFRHYEAAACGSVPLISRPPIEQYAPFDDGQGAFFYDPEPGGLTRTVLRVLGQRESLRKMGHAAREHVASRHTIRARVDHMLKAVGV